jgi:hypothetical protein
MVQRAAGGVDTRLPQGFAANSRNNLKTLKLTGEY